MINPNIKYISGRRTVLGIVLYLIINLLVFLIGVMIIIMVAPHSFRIISIVLFLCLFGVNIYSINRNKHIKIQDEQHLEIKGIFKAIYVRRDNVRRVGYRMTKFYIEMLDNTRYYFTCNVLYTFKMFFWSREDMQRDIFKLIKNSDTAINPKK